MQENNDNKDLQHMTDKQNNDDLDIIFDEGEDNVTLIIPDENELQDFPERTNDDLDYVSDEDLDFVDSFDMSSFSGSGSFASDDSDNVVINLDEDGEQVEKIVEIDGVDEHSDKNSEDEKNFVSLEDISQNDVVNLGSDDDTIDYFAGKLKPTEGSEIFFPENKEIETLSDIPEPIHSGTTENIEEHEQPEIVVQQQNENVQTEQLPTEDSENDVIEIPSETQSQDVSTEELQFVDEIQNVGSEIEILPEQIQNKDVETPLEIKTEEDEKELPPDIEAQLSQIDHPDNIEIIVKDVEQEVISPENSVEKQQETDLENIEKTIDTPKISLDNKETVVNIEDKPVIISQSDEQNRQDNIIFEEKVQETTPAYYKQQEEIEPDAPQLISNPDDFEIVEAIEEISDDNAELENIWTKELIESVSISENNENETPLVGPDVDLSEPQEPEQKSEDEELLENNVFSVCAIDENRGFYFAKNEQTFALYGYIFDEIFFLKDFQEFYSPDLGIRLEERKKKTESYLVKVNGTKLLIEVEAVSMRLVMEL